MSNSNHCHRSRLPWQLGVAISWTLLLAGAIWAQGTRGTIRGVVTDPSGAVVPNATVKLFDLTKGDQELRNVQTGADGAYQFLEIEPAVYNITITATGFAESRLTDIKVEPNRNLQIDAALTAGGVSEAVTVTGSQELIDRESAALGTTVDMRRVVDLPLNGRNVLQLAQLQPGVVPASSIGGGLGIRVNGSRSVENNVQLDGSNNNEVAVGSTVGVQPRPDAVQEFRVLTSNFDAEFGRNAGSVINVVVRSGGNDFHGNARFFYRPTFLSAARFFDKGIPGAQPLRGPTNCRRAGGPTTGPNCDFRRSFERKEFGGNIGGPLYLPRFGEGGSALLGGENRSYFFVDYEGRRQVIGDSRVVTGLPTLAERQGDFSATGRTILDPVTGLAFPGNRIPEARFSPIARYYNQFLPLPDATGRAQVSANELTDNDQLTARLDFRLTNKQDLNGVYSYYDQSVFSPFAFGGASVPGFGSLDLRTTQNYTIRHTYAIKPNLVNVFLIGYARNRQPSAAPVNSTTPAEIGFTANFVADAGLAGPPRINLGNRGLLLGNSIQGPQARVSENFQLQNATSWSVGNHRLKFGFDGTKYRQDQAFLFVNQGIFNFSRTAGTKTTGDDFSDFLLGVYPASIQFGSNGLRDFRQDFVAAFGQDTWRVRPNFTLSYGVRYEYVSPLSDKFDRVAYYRAGAISQRLLSGDVRTLEGIQLTVPAGRRAPVGLVYPGDPDPVLGGTVPRGGVRKDKNNFAPRLGIAWTPQSDSGLLKFLTGGETVIRAGVGMFYGTVIGNTVLQQLTAPGFNGTNSFFNPIATSLADPFSSDPFPGFQTDRNAAQVANPFAASSFNVFAPLSQFSRATDPNIRTPYTLQYNLTVERGFAKDYVLTLSYVGNRGVKLYALEQVNYALGTFFPAGAGRTILTPTQANANLRRLNDDVRLGISQMVSAGNSHYHSFQSQVQKRLSKGLLFQAAYTFSKSINDSDQLTDTLDLLDRRFTRSLSSDDVPHRFVGSVVYDLPFGKNSNGFIKSLIGGFSIGGIATFNSGTPFSVTNPFDTVGTGGGVISLADIGPTPFRQLDPRKNDGRAFPVDSFRLFGDPAAGFNLATQFRRGSAAVNQFRLQNGINNFDLIVIKRTNLGTERANLELRFEAFNAFNHAQFGPNINVAFGSGVDLNLLNATTARGETFGKFTSTREARVVQLAARINF